MPDLYLVCTEKISKYTKYKTFLLGFLPDQTTSHRLEENFKRKIFLRKFSGVPGGRFFFNLSLKNIIEYKKIVDANTMI